jgi:KaiC/GvpD/RAD55 family RecA-like ATPase
MAADNEHRLISKIVRDRVIIPVLQRGVKDDWIVDDEVREVWKFIRKHYTNYKEVPTAAVVKDNYPNFSLYNVEDTIDYLLDKMVEFRRRLLTKSGMEQAIEKLQANDHESALIEMSNTVTKVNEQGAQGTTHVDLTKNSDARLEAYNSLLNHTLLGIPTGFAKIDEATAGLQGGQLITVIAPPKTGKSQIALQVAINTHEAGFVPMFQSFEMNNHEQSQRHDSMRAHVSNSRYRQGKLKKDELARVKDMMTTMGQMKPFHLVDAINGLTIDSLMATAEQLKPDILFVDGVYLMMDQVTGEANTPQALTNITRGLKRVAQRLDIPVIITTQTLLWKMKGRKVSAESIGYSSSFFQDSDVILGLEPVEEDEEIRLLKIVQSRNSSPSETSITWKWDTGCFHDESKAPSCKFCSVWGTP